MIIFKVFKILLPIFVLNWLLSEADLYFPGARDSTLEAFNSVQIPTHNEWEANEEQGFSFSTLGERFDTFIADVRENGLSEVFSTQKASLDHDLEIDLSNLNTDNIFDRQEMFVSLNEQRSGIGHF